MKLTNLFLRGAIAIVSLILLWAGIVLLRGEFWGSGAICLCLAMIGLIFSVRSLEKAPFTPEELEILRPFVLPAIFWTVILSLLIISVFYIADNFISKATDRIAAAAWISSVILGLVAIWGRRRYQNSMGAVLEKISTHRKELVGISIVLVIAFVLRTVGLSMHPYPWSGDEASVGSEAIRILNGEVTNFFDSGWSLQPNWSFVPTAITELAFGKNILAVRLTSALAGTLAVLFTYLAARELFNPTIALMAAAFLASLPYHVHFSRVGVNNVIDSTMSALVFWLLVRGINQDDAHYYYIAGVAAGLCIYTYAGTRLVLILAGIIILFLVIRQRGYLTSHWKHLVFFSIGTLISIAPLAAFFARHPDIFIGRFGQEGILFNGWLVQQASLTGKSVLEILFDQFTHTILVFVASPALENFFNSPVPYLTVFGSILFLLGMGYAFAYLFKLNNFVLMVWFWTVILFGGILTMNPPAHTRLLMTTPPVTMLMALGAYKTLEYIQKFKIVPERLVAPVFVAIVAVITCQNVNFYMFEYRRNVYFQDANGEYAMEVGLMAKNLGKDFQIFLLGSPRVFSGFASLAFIAPDNRRIDLSAENVANLEVNPDQRMGFFAIPENRSLLAEISQKYPGGENGLVYRKPKPDEILFEYYILNR